MNNKLKLSIYEFFQRLAAMDESVLATVAMEVFLYF